MRDKTWYMALILGLVGGVAGIALSGVRSVTEPIIENRALQEKIKPSLEDFFGAVGADNDFIADRKKIPLGKDERGRRQELVVFTAKKGGALVGAALQTASPGFGDDIHVLTAFDVVNKKILGVKTIDQKETKGLGARVSDDSEPFIQQWKGMPYEGGVSLKAAGGAVDAISGATVSSTGFTAAVNKASQLLDTHRLEIEKEDGQ